MAYYKDVSGGKTREGKRRSAEERGGFEDEGSRYGGAIPRGGNRSPRAQEQAAGRPARGNAYGGETRTERPARKTAYGERRVAQPARGNAYGGETRTERPARTTAYGERRVAQPARGKTYGSETRTERPARKTAYSGETRTERPARATAYGGDRRTAQPAREDGRPARREASMRFTRSEQQPYRGRGADMRQPRPYDEQRRVRRDAEAPRQGRDAVVPAPRREYDAFRYEAPARPARPVPAPAAVQTEPEISENLLSGRNPIREALKSGRDIEKMLVARGELSGSAREIVSMARERHIPVQEVERARLDAITPHHQGMLAYASAYRYHTVEDMLALAKERGEEPFFVVLDGITDPHNLGAIIRTAECAGAHGVIVQERRAVGLTPAAVKASAGAIEYVMVARVTNLVATLETLKKQNIWIYAADMAGEDYTAVDFNGGVAIVIGAEGEGVSRLVLETCDRRVALPVRGKLDSLNASVAAGILLYAAMRSRRP